MTATAAGSAPALYLLTRKDDDGVAVLVGAGTKREIVAKVTELAAAFIKEFNCGDAHCPEHSGQKLADAVERQAARFKMEPVPR